MVREDPFHLMLKYYLSSDLLISLLGQRKNLNMRVQLFEVDVAKQDPVI